MKRRRQSTRLPLLELVLGATGFDGFGEGVVACPGSQSPGETTEKDTTANSNLALAA